MIFYRKKAVVRVVKRERHRKEHSSRLPKYRENMAQTSKKFQQKVSWLF